MIDYLCGGDEPSYLVVLIIRSEKKKCPSRSSNYREARTIQGVNQMVEVSIRERVSKARRLCEEGRVKRCGDLYIVEGNTGKYTVDLDHQTYGEVCSCPDSKIQRERETGISCKHTLACTLYEAWSSCRI